MPINLENVGIRTQSGGGILGALERLKSLQSGGFGKGAAPAGEGEETKDESTER